MPLQPLYIRLIDTLITLYKEHEAKYHNIRGEASVAGRAYLQKLDQA